MRRPLKPFVTEYKGARRPLQSQPQGFGASLTTDPQAANPPDAGQGPSSQAADPRGPSRHAREPFSFEADRARPKLLDPMARPDAEDAYDAAMRAADALFTRPSAPEPDRRAAPPRDSSAEDSASAASTERGGRILRVIDEPPPPQFAALEAAYAPKKRGRKPGSKNKPKSPADATAGLAADLAADLAATDLPETSALQRGAPAEPASVAPAPVAAAAPTAQQIEGIAVSDDSARKDAPRGERRAPWLRDRLKPGEGWKRRRLPRVCW